MRDLASCYGDHAVKVAEAACSGRGSAPPSRPAAAQCGVTCFYRSRLSTARELLVRVTWTGQQGLTLAVEDLSAPGARAGTVVARRKKGSRSLGGGTIGVFWDISAARYDLGPEPVEGFYLVVVADAEIALAVGDTAAADAVGPSLSRAEFALVGRREQVLANSHYSTRAKFREGGRDHEIAIRCKADKGTDTQESELWVTIDKKKAVHVRRLLWNFRGNQTIFVDGLPVDIMWDVHDWWFGPDGDRGGCDPAGRAAFMFRTRSGLDSRLWQEEEILRGSCGFSLLIHAFRIP